MRMGIANGGYPIIAANLMLFLHPHFVYELEGERLKFLIVTPAKKVKPWVPKT